MIHLSEDDVRHVLDLREAIDLPTGWDESCNERAHSDPLAGIPGIATSLPLLAMTAVGCHCEEYCDEATPGIPGIATSLPLLAMTNVLSLRGTR